MKNSIEVTPVVTEKTYNLMNEFNKYTFVVPASVSKIDIVKVIESKYKVKVEGINTITRPGKMIRNWKNNRKIRRSDIRKAVVQLKSGDKIEGIFNV